jgi:hypothetical protein
MAEEISHFQARFGMVAVGKEFITADQLVEATVIQVREDVEKMRHRSIGEILVDRGHLTTLQVEEVLREIAAVKKQEFPDAQV